MRPEANPVPELAARLERAYRLALALEGRMPPEDDAETFARHAMAAELVALLDEARAALTAGARGGDYSASLAPTGGVNSVCQPRVSGST